MSHFPHSLGLLYWAFTYYTGFKVNSGEYKVMGLAPYGEPKYKKLILDNLIDLRPMGHSGIWMSRLPSRRRDVGGRSSARVLLKPKSNGGSQFPRCAFLGPERGPDDRQDGRRAC